MNQLTFGDIVLLKFPFTDGQSFKKRPALVINDSMMEMLLFAELPVKFRSPIRTFYWMNGKNQG